MVCVGACLPVSSVNRRPCPAEARRLRESLKSGSNTVEATLLEERIAICEHASLLATTSIPDMKLTVLSKHVLETETLWGVYPTELKINITCRVMQENIRLAYDKVASASEDESEQFRAFLDRLLEGCTLDSSLATMTDADTAAWRGDEPRLSDIVACMLVEDAEIAELEDVDKPEKPAAEDVAPSQAPFFPFVSRNHCSPLVPSPCLPPTLFRSRR